MDYAGIRLAQSIGKAATDAVASFCRPRSPDDNL